MNPTEPDSDTIDWTEVDRTVEQELLGRAKHVAHKVAGRESKAIEDTGRGRKLGPDDPTEEAPAVR
jgi:hypothetical protein